MLRCIDIRVALFILYVMFTFFLLADDEALDADLYCCVFFIQKFETLL